MSKVFKKYKWAVLAGDFNSPFLRNYIWVSGLLKYPKLFDVPNLVIGIASKNNAIEYIGDISTWEKTHAEIIRKAENDIDFIEKIIDATNELGEKFNKWSEKKIFNVNLKKLRNEELFSLLNDFVEKQGNMYAFGTILPTLDFGNFSFIEGNLKKILKRRLSDIEYKKYYEILTEPIHNSFAQDQEEDLLRLIARFYSNKNWRKDVRQKSIIGIRAKYPDFFRELKKHTAKHAWVYYVYVGPAYEEERFLEFIKDYLKKGVDPKEKLAQKKSKKEKISSLRKKYIEKFKPNDFERMILDLVGKFVWAKPRRKDYQSKSYYHLEKLMREIACRLNISLSQARSIPIDILSAALEKEKIDLSILNSINKFHVCLPNDDGKVLFFYGKKANYFYKNFVQNEKAEKIKNTKTIKGTVAYKGKAKGQVKIINSPSDMQKMREGDILVSLATTPSIVPAMKKAAAIVTDEGGLTCHASIVSRELGIPCVVGTKFASKILKDGDTIEVDANNGVIKILKKKR
jgi:phosphohistidine swiveling domain-containing protein